MNGHYQGPSAEVLVQVFPAGKGRVRYKVYNTLGGVQLSTEEAIRVLRAAAGQLRGGRGAGQGRAVQ